MFVEKGFFLSVLSPQESFQPSESQCFVERGFFLSPQMSVFLKIRVKFLEEKVSGKGKGFLEQSCVLLLCLS